MLLHEMMIQSDEATEVLSIIAEHLGLRMLCAVKLRNLITTLYL